MNDSIASLTLVRGLFVGVALGLMEPGALAAAPPGLPSLSISSATVSEGDEGSTRVALFLSLSSAAAGPVSVRYATVDDTAEAGEDYVGVPPTEVTFAVGVTNWLIEVEVLGDRWVEPDEGFYVRLSEPVGAVLGTDTGRVVIVSDDLGSIEALAPPPPLTNLVLNRQSGLFEQVVRFTNLGGTNTNSVRLVVRGLPADVELHNAHGRTTNGLPYVEAVGPWSPGSRVEFLLEFYRANRWAFGPPVYRAEFAIPPVALPWAGTPFDPILRVELQPLTTDLNQGRFLIEFNATPGRRYLVQYRDSVEAPWRQVFPPVTAAGNLVQWFDDGPPKTASKPAAQGARFYQILLLP